MLVDIHSHLLPGVDDGVATKEESLEQLHHYAEAGFTHIVCTPHLHDPYVTTNVHAIRSAYEWISEAGAELGLKMYLGSELYITAEGGKSIPFLDSFQLIETDTQVEPLFLLDRIFSLQLQGLRVIFAHVERYAWFDPDSDTVRRMREMGVYFQVNASTLESKKVKNYLDQGIIDFIASDNHGLRRGLPPFELWKKYSEINQGSLSILGLNT